jgi:hypothetical protein
MSLTAELPEAEWAIIYLQSDTITFHQCQIITGEHSILSIPTRG